MATLFIVATPIGNLEDITLRALRVLQEVDSILCEDTRQTKKLLDRHGISNKKLIAYNEKQSGKSLDGILELLKDGKNLALVSDAGTPGISDPGSTLVAEVQKEFGTEAVVPIPGASALITALSAAGFPASDFLFLGFLPHKKGREKLFTEIAGSFRTVVFYESPHRISKTLLSLQKHLAVTRQVTIGRELTKLHEEFRKGTSTELRAYFEAHPDKVRGEFVVMVERE